MLDVRRLRLLRELKVRGTLAAVAEAMNVTPSAVSQQLTLLEQEVGTELLRKVGSRVQLTLQAEILVEHTNIVLERLELAETDLATSLHTVAGVIRIAVFQSAAIALLPRALSRLAEEFPELRVEVTQREPAIAQFDSWLRDFDLVVTQQYPGESLPHHPELDIRPLTEDALRLAVPLHDSAWSGVRSLAAAANAPWVLEPRGVASRLWAEELCGRAGFRPDVRYEVSDLQTQSSLIAAGLAVAIIPGLFAETQRSAMRMVDLPGLPERRIVTSVRRSLAESPRVRACRSALARVAAA